MTGDKLDPREYREAMRRTLYAGGLIDTTPTVYDPPTAEEKARNMEHGAALLTMIRKLNGD